MDEPNDFERWLTARGIDPAEVERDPLQAEQFAKFEQLWEEYEAWCQEPSFEPPVQKIVPAETVLVLTDERWPARAHRTQVVT